MATWVQRLVCFFERVTVLQLFCMIVVVPTGLMLINILTMQHKGTLYSVTHEIEFEITIAGEPKGQIVIGLFGETVPKTVQNFYTLATSGVDGYKYEGTVFHRVIEKFMIQGGDVVHQDGRGRLSIYGETFPDENFIIKHATLGFVAMANSGPNTNGCQFYITTKETSWLDDKHVVFGKVIHGQGLVHLIEHLDTDTNHRPLKEVRIAKSRARKVKNTYTISDDPYNVWDWMKTISIPLGLSFSIVLLFNHFIKKLDKGIKTADAITLLKEQERKKLLQEDVERNEENDVQFGETSTSLRKREAKSKD